MGLVGYLKVLDPGRISSIGSSVTHRKKLIESIDNSVINLYLLDCSSHEKGSPVIPVMLKQRRGIVWVELGVAKVCPLCWKVLQPPVGIELPDSVPQVVTDNHKRALAKIRAGKKTPQKKSRKAVINPKWEIIMNMTEVEEVTAQEVAARLGISRSPARRYLEMLVSQGRLQAERTGVGRDHQVTYFRPE